MKLAAKIHIAIASNYLINTDSADCALAHLLKARRLGDPQASAILAFIFENGLGTVETSFSTAERLYMEATTTGLALVRLAFLKKHGRPDIKVCSVSAEKYKKMCFKTADPLQWLITASEKLPAAQLALGLCYYNGLGTKESDSSAFELFMKAAESGLASAQNMTGNMYVEGSGVEKNYALGIKWYIKAAEQKEAAAMYNIASLFEKGFGLGQDYLEAYSWYLRAAIYGSTISMNVLGVFNEHGLGTEVNLKEAVKWYVKGSDRGHSHAQYNLGRCYYDGCGVELDLKKALYLFELAASQNHQPAILACAICYEHGIGTSKNMEKAIEFYLVAASFKSDYAIKRLEPVISREIVGAAEAILFPQKLGLRRVDSGYFEEPRTSICTLPTELRIEIISHLNLANILSQDRVNELIFKESPTLNANPLQKCVCLQECKNVSHWLELFN